MITASVSLFVSQKVQALFDLRDSENNPIGGADYAVSFNTIEGDAVAQGDGTGNYFVIPGNSAGESVIEVSFTADFGAGVATYKARINVNAIEEGDLPEGASIGITFGTPVPR